MGLKWFSYGCAKKIPKRLFLWLVVETLSITWKGILMFETLVDGDALPITNMVAGW